FASTSTARSPTAARRRRFATFCCWSPSIAGFRRRSRAIASRSTCYASVARRERAHLVAPSPPARPDRALTARHVGVATSIVNNNSETMERSRRLFPTAGGWFFVLMKDRRPGRRPRSGRRAGTHNQRPWLWVPATGSPRQQKRVYARL